MCRLENFDRKKNLALARTRKNLESSLKRKLEAAWILGGRKEKLCQTLVILSRSNVKSVACYLEAKNSEIA